MFSECHCGNNSYGVVTFWTHTQVGFNQIVLGKSTNVYLLSVVLCFMCSANILHSLTSSVTCHLSSSMSHSCNLGPFSCIYLAILRIKKQPHVSQCTGDQHNIIWFKCSILYSKGRSSLGDVSVVMSCDLLKWHCYVRH